MIGSFGIRRVNKELDVGGVFVAVFSDVITSTDVLLVVIEEEVSERDRGKALGMVFFE